MGQERKDHGYWRDVKNQRVFLDELMRRLGYSSSHPVNWRSVTTLQIKQHGGARILDQYDSLFEALVQIYPEFNWNVFQARKQMPKHFWDDENNQRAFVERFANHFSLSTPEDWKPVSTRQFKDFGGSRLLNKYRSLVHMLSHLYPEEDWDPLSCRKTAPKNFWSDMKNVRQFIDYAKVRFYVKQNEDWRWVSVEQLFTLRGGKRLVNKYGSLKRLLEAVYPDECWDLLDRQQANPKKSGQRLLFLSVQELFPNEEIQEEFSHPKFSELVGYPVQFDVYLPRLRMALEYQGNHHYEDIPEFGSADLYRKRDEQKAFLCQQQGIRLVHVPYWWDGQKESLAATIHQADETLLPPSSVSPIPNKPPNL